MIYDFIFVVLVYRNTSDLVDFFASLKLERTRVIVVNSFYDEESELQFKQIAESNHADFLSVPNKGYGAGHNRGVEYALKHYDFKYLVISNADVEIKKLDFAELEKYGDGIFAPKILTLSGKNQNPSCPFIPSLLTERYKKWCYFGNHRKLMWLYYISSRLKKCIYYIFWKCRRCVFSAHGAFVIFSKDTAKKLFPFYLETMFLFNEEEHLGRLARLHGIKTFYIPEIIINHKEDGSMKIAEIHKFEPLKQQSFAVYYDYWFKNRYYDKKN